MRFLIPLITATSIFLAASAWAGDWPMWCGRPDRNMASDEKGLPDRFDEASSRKTTNLANVKWAVKLGTGAYGSPVISGGKVFLGGAEDAFSRNDTVAALWCFRESDGKLLWRMRSPYLTGALNRSFGVTCTPAIEDGKLWLANHNGDILCLSTEGLAAGNKGPFTDEAGYYATGRKLVKSEIGPDGRRVLEWTAGTPAAPGALDADILWRFDLLHEANAWCYNALNQAPLVRGDYLYVNTGSVFGIHSDGSQIPINAWEKSNGRKIQDSPDLIVLDKNTGKLLALEKEGLFRAAFHGVHASPTLARVNGKDLIIFGAGNGTCWAFEADFAPGPDGGPGALKVAWKFNPLDPANYSPGFFDKKLDQAEAIGTPVFYNNRVYMSIGNDLIKSGRRAGAGRLVCIDATKSGDVSRTGLVWAFDKIRSTSSTPAIADGLLYTADASGTVWCLDAETGKLCWSHDTAEIWGSPLAADGKVFVPTHGRGLLVLAQGRTKKVLSDANGNEDLVSSPAVANGVLYLVSQNYLYALQKGATGSAVGR